MKKLLLPLALLATTVVSAMPVLNPAAPALCTDGVFYCCPNKSWSLRLGFRGDYVFDRKVEDAFQTIQRYSLYANEGVLTLNLLKRADFSLFVGAANQSYNANYFDVPSNVENADVTLNTNTIWGLSIKALLWSWDWGCKYCGTSFVSASFDYESVGRVWANDYTQNGTLEDPTVLPGVAYSETQAALTYGHKIKKLIPYIGFKWSKACANMAGVVVPGGPDGGLGYAVNGMKNRQYCGYVVGVSFLDVARMTVSAEARFVDETAMTVTASFRF